MTTREFFRTAQLSTFLNSVVVNTVLVRSCLWPFHKKHNKFLAWIFIFKHVERAMPLLFTKGHFHWKILKSMGNCWKGHQGQDQGQQRPYPPRPASSSRPDIFHYIFWFCFFLQVLWVEQQKTLFHLKGQGHCHFPKGTLSCIETF